MSSLAWQLTLPRGCVGRHLRLGKTADQMGKLTDHNQGSSASDSQPSVQVKCCSTSSPTGPNTQSYSGGTSSSSSPATMTAALRTSFSRKLELPPGELTMLWMLVSCSSKTEDNISVYAGILGASLRTQQVHSCNVVQQLPKARRICAELGML